MCQKGIDKTDLFSMKLLSKIYVETEVDSDRDGKKDRVSIKVMRPKDRSESSCYL